MTGQEEEKEEKEKKEEEKFLRADGCTGRAIKGNTRVDLADLKRFDLTY